MVVSNFCPCIEQISSTAEFKFSCSSYSRAASSSAVVPVARIDVTARAVDAVVAAAYVVIVRRVHDKWITPVTGTSARIVVLVLDSV